MMVADSEMQDVSGLAGELADGLAEQGVAVYAMKEKVNIVQNSEK
jgi:hypothetical protein